MRLRAAAESVYGATPAQIHTFLTWAEKVEFNHALLTHVRAGTAVLCRSPAGDGFEIRLRPGKEKGGKDAKTSAGPAR